MADKYEASLDQFTLECETIEDNFEKEIAEYEFPYLDGALLEDMGQKARSIRIRCYFWGPEYENHKAFINHLESQELFEFVHPEYGSIWGCVKSVAVRHDDREKTAEIDILFVENLRTPGVIEIAGDPEIVSQTEEAFPQVQQEQTDGLTADMLNDMFAVGSPDLRNAVSKQLDPDQGILSQIAAASRKTRGYIRQIDSLEKKMLATATTVTNPANSLIGTISYAATMPGRLIGTMARAVERQARLLDNLRTSPARFIRSLKSSLQAMENSVDHLDEAIYSFGGRKIAEAARNTAARQLKTACAARLGLEAAYLYRDDQDARQAQKRGEKAASFDPLGRYLRPAAAGATMNVRDLEESLADVRDYIQDAVDQSREIPSLKNMAEDLLAHVNRVKIERERIVEVTLDNEMPLHIVCLKYGLPYNAAERIHAINKIKNPSFTGGTINIYTA